MSLQTHETAQDLNESQYDQPEFYGEDSVVEQTAAFIDWATCATMLASRAHPELEDIIDERQIYPTSPASEFVHAYREYIDKRPWSNVKEISLQSRLKVVDLIASTLETIDKSIASQREQLDNFLQTYGPIPKEEVTTEQPVPGRLSTQNQELIRQAIAAKPGRKLSVDAVVTMIGNGWRELEARGSAREYAGQPAIMFHDIDIKAPQSKIMIAVTMGALAMAMATPHNQTDVPRASHYASSEAGVFGRQHNVAPKEQMVPRAEALSLFMQDVQAKADVLPPLQVDAQKNHVLDVVVSGSQAIFAEKSVGKPHVVIEYGKTQLKLIELVAKHPHAFTRTEMLELATAVNAKDASRIESFRTQIFGDKTLLAPLHEKALASLVEHLNYTLTSSDAQTELQVRVPVVAGQLPDNQAHPVATPGSQPSHDAPKEALSVVPQELPQPNKLDDYNFAGINTSVHGASPELIRNVISYMMTKHGLTAKGAAWLTGNFLWESGLSTDTVGDKSTPGAARGLAQWHIGRRDGMPDDLYGQIDFSLMEMKRDNHHSTLPDTLRDPNATDDQIIAGITSWERFGTAGDRFIVGKQLDQTLHSGNQSHARARQGHERQGVVDYANTAPNKDLSLEQQVDYLRSHMKITPEGFKALNINKQYLGVFENDLPHTTIEPKFMVMHWTGQDGEFKSVNQFIHAIKSREGGCCSVQGYIDKQGQVYQLMQLDQKAYQALGYNQVTVGTEIDANAVGGEHGYTPKQMESFVYWTYYNQLHTPSMPIGRAGVKGHSEATSEGKIDGPAKLVDMIGTMITDLDNSMHPKQTPDPVESAPVVTPPVVDTPTPAPVEPANPSAELPPHQVPSEIDPTPPVDQSDNGPDKSSQNDHAKINPSSEN